MSEEKEDVAAGTPQATADSTAIEPQGEITLSRMRSEGGKTQWKCERASLASVLLGIKNGTWKAQIEGLRAIRDAEARRRAKPFRQPRLDVFGVYADGAREDEIVAKSGWLVCDYDAKDNPGADWDAIKDVMASCPWTGAVFKSASGNGLKWVIRYAAQTGTGIDEENELVQFERIRKFINGLFPTLKVDDAKGARRHTFVSYDATAYVAPFLPAVKKFAPLEAHDERCFLPIETLLRIYAPILATVWSTGREYVERLGDGRDMPPRTESQAFALFSTRGFPKSRKDELMQHIRQHRHLADILATRVGYRAGIFLNTETGERFAVKYSPKWIEPDEGSFPTISALLKARLDDPDVPAQLQIFFKILQNARRRILEMMDAHDAGTRVYNQTRVPMTCIMGEPATGKSKIFETLIRPLLGGRDFDAKKFFTTDDRFTGGLEFNEIMLIDDLSAKAVMKFNRTAMTERGKALYSATISAESKFRDEQTIKDSCHVAFQLFNPETVESTPIYSQAPDKFVFLNVARYATLSPQTPKEWEAFNRAIEKELPAFAYFIDTFELDPRLTENLSPSEQRNGMPAFCHPACLELLTESDPAANLLDEIDAHVERTNSAPSFYSVGAPGDPVLRAADIATALRTQLSAKSVGRILRQLSERTDTAARVKPVYGNGEVKKIRGWQIFAPENG